MNRAKEASRPIRGPTPNSHHSQPTCIQKIADRNDIKLLTVAFERLKRWPGRDRSVSGM